MERARQAQLLSSDAIESNEQLEAVLASEELRKIVISQVWGMTRIVDDVIQEVLIGLTREYRMAGRIRRWKSFVATVAARNRIDIHRQECREKARQTNVAAFRAAGNPTSSVAAQIDLKDCMEKLAREAPKLHVVIEQLLSLTPQVEIAETIGVAPSTVHARKIKGAILLRNCLNGIEGEQHA